MGEFLIVWSKASLPRAASTRRNWRSHRLPPPRLGRAEDGVDDPHVLHGVLEREFGRLAAADRLGEEVALDGVLVAHRECLFPGRGVAERAAVVDEDAAGPVGRRVEGDLHLDPALGAEYLHALIGYQLGRAHEAGLAGREVE